jgi:hypothetical protein
VAAEEHESPAGAADAKAFAWIRLLVDFYVEGPYFPVVEKEEKKQNVTRQESGRVSATTVNWPRFSDATLDPGAAEGSRATRSSVPVLSCGANAATDEDKLARSARKAKLRNKIEHIKTVADGEIKAEDLVDLPFEAPSFLDHVKDMGWGMFSIVQYLVTVLGAIIVIYKELQPYDVR